MNRITIWLSEALSVLLANFGGLQPVHRQKKTTKRKDKS